MTVQPQFHWQFQENSGDIVQDTLSQTKGKLFKASLHGHGRIGKAIRLDALDSRVFFERKVGQFGTSDFTVAFGIKILDPFNQNDTNLIGNRNTSGHGNWFSLRLEGKGTTLSFEVDENTKGKNYVVARVHDLSALANKTWQHIAIVRENRSIKLYLNGALISENKSRTGIANINSGVPMQLGHHTRHTPAAQYEDLRVYDTALSATEINDLIPPVNRPLRAGEIELVATDGAAVTLRKDVENLFRFSPQFQTLRVGPDTVVALSNKANFGGTAQLLYADLPDIKLSRLKDFPASVRIRSAIGNPFTGKWLIKAPNGEFLSQRDAVLSTASKRSFNELFKLQSSLQPPRPQSRQQVIHGAANSNTALKLSPGDVATNLFVEELRSLSGEFAIVNQDKNQWLEMGEKNTFKWTNQEEKRAVFARVAKMADRENQVGELAPGEVALYQHAAYHGRTWILSDTEKDLSGEYPNLSVFQSLADETSSIRLGPETGVTVFRQDKFHSSLEEKTVRPIGRPPIIVRREASLSRARIFRKRRKKVVDVREKIQEAIEAAQASLVEDIALNAPNLSDSQIGDDTISSLKIFRTVEPEDVFTSYTTKLSQDYKMVGDKLEEFSAYRTTLRFEPSDRKLKVEVSATDLTKIEVEGTIYKIDESRSVSLSPNEINRIMITSEADGINTPGLKIRTSAMALNERVVIFPNQAAHQQIAELEEGALWNAKDAQGNFIVDREAHSQAEVASVQNTIKQVMATVVYADEASENRPSSSTQPPSTQPSTRQRNLVRVRAANVETSVGVARSQGTRRSGKSVVTSSSRVVSGETINRPWKIEFGAAGNTSQQFSARATSRAASRAAGSVANEGNRQNLSASTPKTTIQETEISQDEFAQLLSRAIPEERSPNSPGFNAPGSKPTTPNLPGPARFIKIGNPFKTIGDALKSGASATIGFFEDAVNVLVETAQGVFRFVVDTVEKVAEFVEAVVEKVVKAIKQFIEFLQFLFNWDDILKTQRYLVGAVNAGFDYAVQLADDAKPHVSAFVDNLQDTVKDGMDTLVEKLGGDPSEVQKSEAQMPEAMEWFLSKLFGGSKKTAGNTDAASSDNSGDGSPLEAFVRHLLEALEDVVNAGLRGLEGVSESITTLLKDPLSPERALVVIIEALRDVIIQLLDGVENIALGLLEVVKAAIDVIQKVLNSEIKIPFISDLFEFVGGGKLTILNLSTLLLAIPVTVVHKIVFNERPFKHAPQLDFSSPLNFASSVDSSITKKTGQLSKASQSATGEDQSEQSEELSKASKSVITGLGVTSLVANFANGVINSFLDIVPEIEAVDKPRELNPFNGAIELVTLLNDFFIWLPSIPGWMTEGSPNFTKVSTEEIVLWVFRTGTLALDFAVTAYGWLQTALNKNTQTMRRANPTTIILSSGLGVLDSILAAIFVGTSIKKEEQALHFFHQRLFSLPRTLGFLRLETIFTSSNGASAPILPLVDLVTGLVTTATGFVLLGNDFEGVEAAIIPQS